MLIHSLVEIIVKKTEQGELGRLKTLKNKWMALLELLDKKMRRRMIASWTLMLSP